MDMKRYWGRIREIRETLPEIVTLISVDNEEKGTKGGSICTCSRYDAAKFLFLSTHRVATPEEIAAYEAKQEVVKQEISDAEYKSKSHFALPKELADLVQAAIRPPVKGK